MRIRATLLAATLLIPAGGALAQAERPGTGSLVGAGTRLCSNWTEARRTGQGADLPQQWALGFLNAVNITAPQTRPLAGMTEEPGATPDTVPLPPDSHPLNADVVWSWLDSYCAAHPGERFGNAVIAYAGRNGVTP